MVVETSGRTSVPNSKLSTPRACHVESIHVYEESGDEREDPEEDEVSERDDSDSVFLKQMMNMMNQNMKILIPTWMKTLKTVMPIKNDISRQLKILKK